MQLLTTASDQLKQQYIMIQKLLSLQVDLKWKRDRTMFNLVHAIVTILWIVWQHVLGAT